MLALPEKPTPTPEKKPEPKRRTITLTNRAPVQIIEDEWPEVAQGCVGEPDIRWPWSISLRVRRRSVANYSTIIYGIFDEGDEEHGQIVRVGRYIYFLDEKKSGELEKHILEVGEEMRERIDHEKLRRQVTHAVDRCIASLPAKVL